MIIKVYQSVEDSYIEMKVIAKYKYTGETDELSFINGKIYNCVGYEKGFARIVDETNEDYLYQLNDFELTEIIDKDEYLKSTN